MAVIQEYNAKPGLFQVSPFGDAIFRNRLTVGTSGL